jgi:hypothetical protein
MSLDVYLTLPTATKTGSGIFYREDGRVREITHAEWNEKFPNREPIIVVNDDEESLCAFSANITHNLGKMADAAGLYKYVWRPDENEITYADQLIAPFTEGLTRLKENPEEFKKHNPENGWGSYDVFVKFMEEYLDACKKYPQALVKASR